MVIDSSALIAILLGEPVANALAEAIAADARRMMSAFSVLECGIVIEAKKGDAGGQALDLLIHRAHIEVIALTGEQMELARAAWRKFGKGRHPAALNIGDCCSYALAKYTGEPLLFVGDDFAQTDISILPL
jgi:ribonuclease VapC